MVKRLETEDRNILEFRPLIDFVEPDPEPGVIQPQPETEVLQLEDIQQARDEVKRLASAVNALAVATQARLDDKAKDMVIKLDRVADQDAIQAMLRHFPDADPTQITYQQYRECKEEIRNAGRSIGTQAVVTPDDVALARDEAAAAGTNAGTKLGGFGTDEARFGQLRPELDNRSIIIPPIEIERMQIDMICILINFCWKFFIKPVFRPIAIPPPFGPSLSDLLPDTLCDPGGGVDIPGLYILGDKKVPDRLSGKAATDAARQASAEAAKFGVTG